MNKVRLASLALAAFAVCFGSVAMADCGGGGGNNGCGGRQGLFAKLHAKKQAGCDGCNGGGLFAKLHAKKANRCGGAPSCCAPAPTCCPAPAPSCGCAAPAPSCGCAAPAAPSCGCGVSAPVSTGCSSCGTTMDAGTINTTIGAPAVPAAPVSDKAPAA